MALDINNNSTPIAANKQRISELDLLRGFAVFGILFMNIVAMGYPVEAYNNPFAFSLSDLIPANDASWFDGQGLNNTVFSLAHVFLDQKMMGLFSLLFGASTMLFLSTLKEKKQSVSYYYKRNAWLFSFGLIHGTFLFNGDILFIYSLCAFLIFFFSDLRPTVQLIIGIAIYSLPIILQFRMQLSISNFSVEEFQQFSELWKPNLEYIKATAESNRTVNYLDWVASGLDMTRYQNKTYDWYLSSYLIEAFTRAFGMMLIGMSFFTWGFLPNRDNRKSINFYRKTLNYCLPIGLAFIILGLLLNFHYQWQASYSAVGGRLLNHIGTPFMICAYIAMLVLWSNKSSVSLLTEKFKEGLQSVGRMALTNYIMQSTFGLFLFTGVGFSLHSQLNRLELVGVVLSICLFQLHFSKLWLKHFNYGPLEWLWRSLTFAKLMK